MANEVRNEAIEYAKSQFDAAFRRLEAAQSRLQALAADPGGDEAVLQMARASYDQARLLWLCSNNATGSAACPKSPAPSAKSPPPCCPPWKVCNAKAFSN